MTERELHEAVAQRDSHLDQTKGIVSWFYKHCINTARQFVATCPGPIVDIGSGEGVMFSGDHQVIELDISMMRLLRVRNSGPLVCADAYNLPFADQTFKGVLLVAILEHTRQPEQILSETFRVLQHGGQAFVIVPNDLNMSIGRLLLGKWPPRYPDHLTFFTPSSFARCASAFTILTAYPMPFPRFSFWLNMYWFAILRRP